MKEVFLHVGIHKTGSSSIQDTITNRNNRKIFLENNLHVLNCLPSNHSEFVYSAFSDFPEGYHTNILKERSTSAIKQYVSRIKDLLKAEVKDNNYDKFIITAEDACVLSPSAVKRLKDFIIEIWEDVKISVVMYTRDPINYVESASQQNVKGNSMTIPEAVSLHISKSTDRYRNKILNFEYIFGKTSFRVFKFEDACNHNFGIVGHFFSLIGMKRNVLKKLEIIKSNKSISYEALCIISHLNKKRNGSCPSQIHSSSIDKFKKIRGSKGKLLNPDQIQKIKRLCSNDLEFLNLNYDIQYNLDNNNSFINDSRKEYWSGETVSDLVVAFIDSDFFTRQEVINYFKSTLYKHKVEKNNFFNEEKFSGILLMLNKLERLLS
jgi:hypothetical protein